MKKRLALLDQKSKNGYMGMFWMICFFVVIYLTFYFNLQINAWWLIFPFFTIAILQNIFSSSKMEIYDNGSIIILNETLKRHTEYQSSELFFYKFIGNSKSIDRETIIIGKKSDNKKIFRIPLGSDEEKEKLLSIFQRLNIKEDSNYMNFG